MSTKNNGKDHGSKRAQSRTERRSAKERRVNSANEHKAQLDQHEQIMAMAGSFRH